MSYNNFHKPLDCILFIAYNLIIASKILAKGDCFMQNITEKPTMSVTEAANLLGISAPTMYAITDREDFTALIRIGRRKLVLRTKLLEWLDAQANQPHKPNE